MPINVSWESESQGFMTGTQGYVVYTMLDGSTTVTINWDNPYWGSNEYSIVIDGLHKSNYSGSYDGGSGDNATVNFTLANSTS